MQTCVQLTVTMSSLGSLTSSAVSDAGKNVANSSICEYVNMNNIITAKLLYAIQTCLKAKGLTMKG